MTTADPVRAPRGRRSARPSGDDREQAILATARRLMEERPFGEVSVDDLARGAGLSRPTFYFYFKSKEAVLLSLLEPLLARVDENFEGAAVRVQQDPPKMFHRGIKAFFTTFASDAAIERALALASGVSLNIETAGEEHFAKLTARKDYLQSVIAPLKRIAALTAKGSRYERVKTSTQFVVGAADETDKEIVRYMGGLYGRLGLRGIYFSAYQRGLGDPSLPGETSPASNAELLTREHRLYQTDYLLRKYGFGADEIGFDGAGNLPLDVDPKEFWARRHPERFPVDVNRADKAELLRVPGLGPLTVKRILAARKNGGRLSGFESVGLRGARARKAAAWTAF